MTRKVCVPVTTKLQFERQSMKPYKRAFYRALLMLPHGNSNLFEFVNTMMNSPLVPVDISLSWTSVTQFERLHPDISLWATPFIEAAWPGKEIDQEALLDLFFRMAMAIESGDVEKTEKQKVKFMEMIDG